MCLFLAELATLYLFEYLVLLVNQQSYCYQWCHVRVWPQLELATQ